MPENSSIARVLGKVPSGLFLLCAGVGADAGAILASWVQQAGFAPPSLSVAIAVGRPIGEIIRRDKKFSLCILAENDTTLMKRFARGTPEPGAFDGLDTLVGANGIPLPTACAGALECDLLDIRPSATDHDLFVGAITAAHAMTDAKPFTHTRGNGLKY